MTAPNCSNSGEKGCAFRDDYALITPARNEAEMIGATIESILRQTIRPRRWVIVNDASTDRTAEIVQSYADQHPFIRLVNRVRDGSRNFGAKAMAFAEGVNHLANVPYAFIGCLDADITFAPNYYEENLRRIQADPSLGLVGGSVGLLVNGKFVSDDLTLETVGGAVQFFRRECFEKVGGYQPLRYGGIDAAAEIKTRMLGWKVGKFLDLQVIQGRDTSSVGATPLQARFREGKRFHSLGYGLPLYLIRCVYRPGTGFGGMQGLASLAGYLSCVVKGEPITLDPEAARFWRRERWSRMFPFWAKRWRSDATQNG